MNALTPEPGLVCEPDWLARPLSALATHIAGVYHEHTREQLPRVWFRVTELANQHGYARVPQLWDLSRLLAELRDLAETHAWTEDDLLFPVLVAHEHPAVLTTTLTPDALVRLVESLGAEHISIRRLLGRLSAHMEAADALSSDVPGWPELRTDILGIRDHLLEELDLEDRCLLPRARDIAALQRTMIR